MPIKPGYDNVRYYASQFLDRHRAMLLQASRGVVIANLQIHVYYAISQKRYKISPITIEYVKSCDLWVSFPVTLNDLLPGFQGHGSFRRLVLFKPVHLGYIA